MGTSTATNEADRARSLVHNDGAIPRPIMDVLRRMSRVAARKSTMELLRFREILDIVTPLVTDRIRK